MRLRTLTHPLVLAFLLTASNAIKPVVIDDTAYLYFARHVAQHPLDPYGFELFWYDKPEPAMEIILPPLVPYWLGAGIALFGEDLVLLKLWLYPFAAILAYAARFLVRRFVGTDSGIGLALLVVGPGVLPFFNFMLDVPAVAFLTAAVALGVRGTDAGRRWGTLVLSGICLGLALQTKYAVLGLPAVLLAVGVVRRRWQVVVPLAVGACLFAGWEAYLVAIYGRSHFVYHLTRKGSEAGLLQTLAQKVPLIQPLVAYLGLTVAWIGLLGLSRVVSPRVLRWVAGVLVALALVVVFVPGRWTVLMPTENPLRNPLTLADVFFRVVGVLAAGVGVRFAVLANFRWPSWRLRPGWEAKFLLAWLVLELGTYFAVTPFPAGRRVLGLSVVLALIGLRIGVRLARTEPRVRAAAWVLPLSLLGGVAVAGIDAWDALPERELPRHAAQVARDRGWTGQGYFVGHWGLQYYAEREGLRIVVPGKTLLRPGDWLLLAVNPDGRDFYRPNGAAMVVDPNALTPEVGLVWDDPLAAQTIPTLYAGRTPVLSLRHPRMAVTLYRLNAHWIPQPVPQ